MKKITSLILSLLLVWASSAIAQQPNLVPTFVSPKAASLGKAAETPVSLYTGTPRINYPLYTVKDGPLSVPVSLAYDASGVKPDAHPGWMGMGWHLNAGGVITRVIKGAPDETYWSEVLAFSNGQTGYLADDIGYAYNTNLLNTANWNTTSYISSLAGDDDPTFDWKETEPDKFIFNFNGYTGTFYVGPGGVYVNSDKDITINLEITSGFPYYDTTASLNPNDLSTYTYYVANYLPNINAFCRLRDSRITGFEAITEDGTRYYFGYYGANIDPNFDNVEFSVDLFGQIYANERWDSWYLTKIVSADGQHKIDFTYQHEYPTASFGYDAGVEKASGQANPGGLLGIFGPVSARQFNYSEGYSGRLIRSTYLKEITSSDTKIDFSISASSQLTYNYAAICSSLQIRAGQSFNYNILGLPAQLPILGDPADVGVKPNVFYVSANDINGNNVLNEVLDFNILKWYKLDKITISPLNSSTPVKSFSFSYNNVATERLKLLSFHENGPDGTSLPGYEFTYDNSKTLPPYNSLQTDHWGYFNGHVAQIDPNNETTWANYKAQRNPVAAYLYAGTISQIENPLGGITQFTYEPNQYNKIVERNATNGAFSISNVTTATAGGLRIKQISIIDPSGGKTITKNFQYDPGILGGDVQYYWQGFQDKLANGNVYTSDKFVSQSILPLSDNGNGGFIGYSKVTESVTNGGRTEYYFSNYDSNSDLNFDATIDPKQSAYSQFTSKATERGKLIKKLVYNASGQLVKKEINTYAPNDVLAGAYIPAVATKRFMVLGGIAVSGTAYKDYLYPYSLHQQETTTYDVSGQNPVSTVSNFTYDGYKNIKEKSTKNSLLDKTYLTDYTYPYDYPPTDFQLPVELKLATIRSMVDKNMVAFPTEIVNHVKQGSIDKVTGATFNVYGSFQDFIGLAGSYSLGISAPVSDFSPSSIFVNSEVVNSVMHFYEDYKIDSRYFSQANYSYDTLGNLSLYHSVKEGTKYFIWDYNRNYPIAEVNNADNYVSDQYDAAFTSFEADGKGNWIFSGVPSTAGGSITGKKSYSLLSGALSVPNLISFEKYIVSYWLKSGGSVSISGGSQSNAVTGKTINGWTYHEVTISNTYSVSISGSGYIDEVRLYPLGATMTTYTYDPLTGMTSQCDATNNITYYEYDNAGRPKLVRDEDGKILSQHDYQYQAANNQ